MKRSLAIAVGTVALLAAGMPLAQDAKAPAANPNAAAAPSGSPMDMSGQMDEHMQMMKALHEKMMSATTPEARRIVMAKQREAMQSGMAMMSPMMQGGGMMGNMGGGMMGQKAPPADAGAQMPMMPMMQMMQKRMDMMQTMMQAMMDQQAMMVVPPTLDATPKK